MYLSSLEIRFVMPPEWKCKAGWVVPSFNIKTAYGQANFGSDLRIECNAVILKLILYLHASSLSNPLLSGDAGEIENMAYLDIKQQRLMQRKNLSRQIV